MLTWLALPLGLALGALVNLVADSLPWTGRPGAPRCAWCGGPRPAWQASAALSLLARAWRCDYCGQGRGNRPWLVDALSVLVAAGLLARDGDLWQVLGGWGLAIFFLVVLVLDVEHRLIPHRVTGPAAVFLGVIGVLDPARGPAKTLLGGAVGFGVMWGFYLFAGVFTRLVTRLRREPLEEVAFGFGDVTLSAVIGLAVGWPGVILALTLGILAAGLFSGLYLLVALLSRRYRAFVAIPYGPFLILGGSLVYYGGRDLFVGLVGG